MEHPPEKLDSSNLYVRLARKEQRMSLKDLAEKSGLSMSFLSNYENGKVNISVASLKKISLALGTPISRLVMDDTGEVMMVRKNERHTLLHHKTPTGVAETDYLVRGQQVAMNVTVNRLPPHSETGEYTVHGGEEFIYVVRGVAAVLVNDTRYLLEQGDFIYYSSEKLHKVANESDEEMEYLQANTPPTF